MEKRLLRPRRHGWISRRAIPSVLLALGATLGVIAGACRSAPEAPDPAPRLLVVGPQATCVTGAGAVCAGDRAFLLPANDAALAAVQGVGFGLRHGCALDAAGGVSCWGDASQGQLGVDPATVTGRCYGRPCSPAPLALAGVAAIRAVTAGWLHTCGLAAGGSVLCWGDDSLDQLGRSAAGPAAAPVEGLPAAVTQVSAGGLHTCALAGDGSVLCWGDGSSGQLGQGAAEDSGTPVAVAGLAAPAVEIAAGSYHTCARLADGGVACWGANRFGQLGDGTRTTRTRAVAVAGLAGPAVDVEAGASFTCALLAGGAVQCWGSNELGELGQGFDARPPGPDDPADPPATVEGLAQGVVALRLAGNHACARKEDGTLLCWGANELGQLGDGTVEGRDVPVPWKGGEAEPPKPTLAAATTGPLQGVDVSYHSGRVDWTAAAAEGHVFGLTLATAGVDFIDPFFISHWERMRQAGLARGAYHFFVPDDDPEAQARAFLAHVVFEPGDLAPVVDLETLGSEAGEDLPARLLAFIRIVEREVGTKPIIYTGPAFWNSTMNDQFGDYPLWIAEYGVEQPTIPRGWKRWHLWQWRGNAPLPHVAPIVDLDRLHPESVLTDLLIPAPGPGG